MNFKTKETCTILEWEYVLNQQNLVAYQNDPWVLSDNLVYITLAGIIEQNSGTLLFFYFSEVTVTYQMIYPEVL